MPFLAVGKPAPPRPRSPDFITTSMTSSGVYSVRTLPRALIPVLRQCNLRYFPDQSSPQLRKTTRTSLEVGALSSSSTSFSCLSTNFVATRPLRKCSSTRKGISSGVRVQRNELLQDKPLISGPLWQPNQCGSFKNLNFIDQSLSNQFILKRIHRFHGPLCSGIQGRHTRKHEIDNTSLELPCILINLNEFMYPEQDYMLNNMILQQHLP